MNKSYLFLTSLLMLACNSEDLVSESNPQTQYAQRENLTYLNLENILVENYLLVTTGQNFSIEQKLHILKEVASTTDAYLNITESKIPDIELDKIFKIYNETDYLFQSINRSTEFIEVINFIVNNEFTLDEVSEVISHVDGLEFHEKELLNYLSLSIYNNDKKKDKEPVDMTWKKRRALFLLETYNNNSTSAPFFGALSNILDR